MTNAQINQVIHEAIGLGCWHTVLWDDANRFACTKCGENHGYDFYSPDYCASLDAVAKAEAFVTSKVGFSTYYTALIGVVSREFIGFEMLTSDGCIGLAALSTARQRVEAVLRALNLWEGHNER